MPRKTKPNNATATRSTLLADVGWIIALLNARLVELQVEHDSDHVSYEASVDGSAFVDVDVAPLVAAGLTHVTSRGLYFALDGGALRVFWMANLPTPE